MKAARTTLLFLIAGAAPLCGAEETSVAMESGEDVYHAGVSVQISRPVGGDAVLAGGTILVTDTVGQDVLATGGTLTVTGRVGDDLRGAGGSITITDEVAGDVLVAGGTATLAEGSVVGGNAWIAGGVLRLTGTIRGDLRAAGGEVVIAGRVEGDADVYADSLTVTPGTVINGTLHHRGPEPAEIADDAQIGEVIYTASQGFDRPGVSILGGLLASLLVFASLAVCTLVFISVFPNGSREAADNVRNRMLASLGVGVLTVIITPIVAALIFALLLTAPIAVGLFAAYVVALILGTLTTLACLGEWLRGRFLAARGEGAGMRIASVLLAALVAWLVGLVPLIGAVIVVLAFTTGVGGLILLATRLYKKPDTFN